MIRLPNGIDSPNSARPEDGLGVLFGPPSPASLAGIDGVKGVGPFSTG